MMLTGRVFLHCVHFLSKGNREGQEEEREGGREGGRKGGRKGGREGRRKGGSDVCVCKVHQKQ